MLESSPAFSSFAVKDISRARQFYQEVLGLDVKERSGMLSLTSAGGARIMVYPKPDFQPATYTVLNFNVKDISQTAAKLRSAGVSFEQYDQPGIKTDQNGIASDERMNMKIAWFKDPDGNILSIVEGDMD